MRGVVTGLAVAVAALAFSATAAAAPGDLDPSFSNDGFAEVPGGGLVVALAVTPIGSVLTLSLTSDERAYLARVTAQGEADHTFSGDGVIEVRPDPLPGVYDIATQADGSVLLAGGNRDGGAIARFTEDGTLDATWGDAGILRVPDLQSVAEISIDPVGRVIAGGRSEEGVRVLRLLADGSLDASFASEEIPGFFDPPSAIAYGDDGSIFVGVEEGAVMRFSDSGELDRSFGTDGLAAIGSIASGEIQSIAVLPDQSLAVGFRTCSTIGPSAGHCAYLTRRLSVTGQPAEPELAGSPTLMLGDRLITAVAETPRFAPAALAISRYSLTGDFDPAFGQAGNAYRYQGVHGGQVRDMQISPDGDLVIATRIEFEDDYLARVSMDAGPADGDADGVLDSGDRCPTGYSRDESGCRNVQRQLTVREDRHDNLVARVRAVTTACITKTKVTLYERLAGADRRVDTGAVSYPWRTEYFDPPGPGRFYARAHSNYTPLARCLGARSSAITLD